jgi:hypothetical protein
MRKNISILILVALIPFLNYAQFRQYGSEDAGDRMRDNQNAPGFEENKGQVRSQHGQPRPDVLFSGESMGMVYHIGRNGLSYQLVHQAISQDRADCNFNYLTDSCAKREIPDQTVIYRIDINWLNACANPVIEKGRALPGYQHYYNVPDGTEPVLHVMKYESITFRNVWEGVDLRYFTRNGNLETDWLVEKPEDYRKIRFEVSGADLCIDKEDFLVMRTPFGEIREGKLTVFQGGVELRSVWKIEGNVVSLHIPYYKKGIPLHIDPPVLVSGTYYGGVADDDISSCRFDMLGNLYVSGRTKSVNAIATTGSHHAAIAGDCDAFLVKFDASGVRKWGTYYGGLQDEYGNGCAIDSAGNVYLVGASASNTSIATTGTHQTANGGGDFDAYLVRFDSNGVREWGTYYGGDEYDSFIDIVVDSNGMLYIVGQTSSSTAIATLGTHQQAYLGAYDAFLVKFNANGVRQWGTYFGGTASDAGESVGVDSAGNVIIAGSTRSEDYIATPGAHQVAYGGWSPGLRMDAFLARFDGNGLIQWATYYGGKETEWTANCFLDPYGNIYLVGQTESDTAIASQGASQGVLNGTRDAFLAKFSDAGVRQWGTYFGGELIDYVYGGVFAAGHIFITGGTMSATGVATSGTWQPVHGGGNSDALLAKFTTNGALVWGTYFGQSGIDVGNTICADENNQIVIGGTTYSSSGMATMGAHQPFFGGMKDGFIARFIDCADFIAVQPQPQNGVLGGQASFNVTPGNPVAAFQWQTDIGSGFQDLADTGQYNGTTTSTLTLTGLLPSNHAQPFRCIVTMPACAITSQQAILTISNIGIEESVFKSTLLLFPNPATNTLFVRMKREIDDAVIIMTDITGRQVLKSSIYAEVHQLDVGKFSRGVYLLTLMSNKDHFRETFMVVLE